MSGARTILAKVPEYLLHRIDDGSAEQIGMLVRDTATKRILAHLQETEATQVVFGRLLETTGGLVRNLSPDPLKAVAGFAAVVQNEQIKVRLGVLETMMGGLQNMQMAALATSVAGIGVTVASTAVILSRLTAMDRRLGEIGETLERQREAAENWDLTLALGTAKSRLGRLVDADAARDPEPMLRAQLDGLHEGFDLLRFGAGHVVRRESVNPEFLIQLVSVMSLCSLAQVRTLVWLDELDLARVVSARQVGDMQELALQMPLDRLTALFDGAEEAAEKLDTLFGDARLRLASVPGLAASLQAAGVGGRDYLETAAAETVEPLLAVPAR